MKRFLCMLMVFLSAGVFAQDAQAKNPVRLQLPDGIYAVPGVEMNVYFDNITCTITPGNYVFDVTCRKGRNNTKFWTYTPKPEDVGTYDWSVKVINDSGVVAEASTKLHVAPADAGKDKDITVLLVGDSLTHGHVYPTRIFNLFQQRTVLQNVMFPLEVRHESKAASAERAHELLRLVSLDDKASRYPSELSGGQQQRVAIARALANEPHYMLCDEATSALDSRTTVQVLDLLAHINEEMGVTMVVITHSLAVAQRVCNRIAVIDSGHVVEEGVTADVFANPQSQVARELLGWGYTSAEGGDEQ